MKHSSTYPFRRWYRKPLTPRESAVIGQLERRRSRTGRVQVVLTVSAAEHTAISRLLLHYALFLNNRCTLSCTLLVATPGAPTAAGRLTPNSTLPTSHCTACRRAQIVGLHPGAAATGAKTVTDRAVPHCARRLRRRAHPARAGPNSSLLTARSATNS